MIKEMNEVQRFFGAKFGISQNVPDGIYPIPTTTSKGKAFMRFEIKNKQPNGSDNFKLYWDEKLTISWYTERKPFFTRESKFSKAYRNLQRFI